MLVSVKVVIGRVEEVDEGPDPSTALEDAERFSACWAVPWDARIWKHPVAHTA